MEKAGSVRSERSVAGELVVRGRPHISGQPNSSSVRHGRSGSKTRVR